MKILFCTNKFTEVTNGPAKFANLLLQINDEYPEHELRILTEDIDKSVFGVYKLELNYPSVLVLLSQFFRIFAYHQKAKKIKKTDFDFDVIVYNNAFIGLLSAYHFPNSVGMINDDNNAVRSLKSFEFNYIFVKQYIFKQLEKISVRFHDQIIVNSIFLKQLLTQKYPIGKNKYRLLYKAVEHVSLKSIQHIFNAEYIRVLFVKSDFKRGGLKDLIEALSLTAYNFDLTVVGPGSENNDLIRSWANEKTNINLRLLGPKPQQVVFSLLSNSTDIFCVPSHQEALGVANLEAMVRGVPVISTWVGGIPEVLAEGKNGWLVPPQNPQALAQAFIECITNKKIRNRKIMAGIEASKKFSVKHCLETFLKITTER